MSQRRPLEARRVTPARSLPRPVAAFLHTEAAGGLVLVAAAAVALVWANSPWQHGYEALWSTRLVISVGPLDFSEDLRHVVDDALMTVFFFVVGLEIKRELVHGELADRRKAVLPVACAIGGMLVPPLVYLAVIAGGPGADGWAIPMATDIAFAAGVLALLGRRQSTSSLSVLLLTLAVVDDIGAIVVIAVVYTDEVRLGALAVAASGLALTALLHRKRVDWAPVYVLLAVATWYAAYRSGIHPTLAGVALGLVTPATPLAPAQTVKRWVQDLANEPTASDIRDMTILARASVSPVERLEELLHPVTSFVVLPLFALANAGVTFREGMLSADGAARIAAGVALGLLVGKTVGVLGAGRLTLRSGIGSLPEDVAPGQLRGLATLAGIGFTVSLFIAGLAFEGGPLEDAAKVGILGGSVLAALLGSLALRVEGRRAGALRRS